MTDNDTVVVFPLDYSVETMMCTYAKNNFFKELRDSFATYITCQNLPSKRLYSYVIEILTREISTSKNM